MDAVLYPAADHFVAPVRVSRILSTHDTAIADLRDNSAAWAIVVKTVPAVAGLFNVPLLRPHLGNFSMVSLLQFGALKGDGFAEIDAQLRALGPQS